MSPMRLNACLDASHHGPPHPFRDAGAVADSLTAIHNAMVKCLFIVKRSTIHKGVYVSPQVQIQRSLASVEAMQLVRLYLSIGDDKCY
jgi:hypothetical protein